MSLFSYNLHFDLFREYLSREYSKAILASPKYITIFAKAIDLSVSLLELSKYQTEMISFVSI